MGRVGKAAGNLERGRERVLSWSATPKKAWNYEHIYNVETDRKRGTYHALLSADCDASSFKNSA